jgi:hypothetical protein
MAYWAPWVAHPTAALKLSGQDLGEFVKFVPTIGRAFPRQMFYFSPLAVSLILVLLAAHPHLPYPRWFRSILLFGALAVLAGLLPPVWGHPSDLWVPEFRAQAIAFLFGVVVVLGHGALRQLTTRLALWILGALGGIALVVSLGAFWAVKGRIWSAYGTPHIYLGWGFWAEHLAWATAVLASATLLWGLRQAREERSKRSDA